MRFRSYASPGGTFELIPTLRALLTESGEHVFRVAFQQEAEQTRNFIFGVMATETRTRPTEPKELCGWGGTAEVERCVLICYELCDAFPLCEGSAEQIRLQLTMQRILGGRVRLLPFTQFQRSVGWYPALQTLFADDSQHFVGSFRDEPDSLQDLKMHVVLTQWTRAPSACPPAPFAYAQPAARPHDEWNTCFSSLAGVFWYHAYVYEAIGVAAGDDFGESSVQGTHEALCASGGADVPGKLALLDILKLVYRYNYNCV